MKKNSNEIIQKTLLMCENSSCETKLILFLNDPFFPENKIEYLLKI